MGDDRDLAVVLPTDRDRTYLDDPPDGYRLHWIDDGAFDYPRPDPAFDMVAYTERCAEYVGTNEIDGVVYSHDIANLVAGVLNDEHGLPGPGFESMFLTDHKYYSRRRQPETPWFDAIDLETGEWGELEPRFPCYIKPAFLTMTLLQHGVETPAELEEALGVLRDELPVWNDLFREFFARYVDLDRYPLATDDVAVVEERLTDWTQHCVEGWTDPDGEAHVWAVSDHNYYPGDHLAIDNYATPSTLPPDERADLVDLAVETVGRHGIEGGFWNVELFRLDDRNVVTEVNGRAATVWEPLYRGTFDASVYEGLLHLAAGRPGRVSDAAPGWEPEGEGDRVGGQFHAVTLGEGPAEDYVDFDFARDVPDADVELFVEPGDAIEQTRTSGVWLARFHLFGDDYGALRDRADEIRANLVNRPAETPAPERYRD
ncbi:MAG: acetyl-CoA carboxylase biotin carboxylase subunit family protein [Halobacteriales archaeon]